MSSISDGLFQLNVLIDDAGNAVLCDFGLSRIKTDITSRTATLSGGEIVGSRNWMAPERLMGGALKKPCDIYSFGMTLHEVNTRHIVLKTGSDSTAFTDLCKRDTIGRADLFTICGTSSQARCQTGMA